MGFAAWPSRVGAAWFGERFVSFGKKGQGDITVLLPRLFEGNLFGIHGEIECKTGGAVQSKKQKTHMKVIRSSGGVYLVVRDRRDLLPLMAAGGYPPRDPGYRPSARPARFL